MLYVSRGLWHDGCSSCGIRRRENGDSTTEEGIEMKGEMDAKLAMGVVFVVLCARPALPTLGEQQNVELMKCTGPNVPLSIHPGRVGGTVVNRVTDLVGLLFERQGLKNIASVTIPLDPENLFS
jgi:hypothetical protein